MTVNLDITLHSTSASNNAQLYHPVDMIRETILNKLDIRCSIQ